MSMMYAAAAGAAVGMASSIMGGKAAAKQADRMRAAEMVGAKLDYASTESSVNLMKAINREKTQNLVQEALRSGAAKDNNVRDEITRATSTLASQSEGLTSGRSKGRQMIEMQVKGNQALLESKSSTASMVNNITDKMDETTNQLNNKLINAHQEMATILSTPSAIYKQNPMEVVQAGISGAQQGASLGSSMKSAGMFSGASTSTAGADSWTTGTSGLSYDYETMGYN